MNLWLGWLSTALSLIGCLLLALNTSLSKWGFVVFIASNITWVLYALETHQVNLIVLQFGFGILNVLAIWRWFRSK